MPDDYDAAADMRASVEFAYEAIRARVAAGGPGWCGYPQKATDDDEFPWTLKGTAALLKANKAYLEAWLKCPKTG